MGGGDIGEERHERPLRVAVGGFLALTAAMGIGRFVYTPILPFMSTDLHLSTAEGGLIASANFLGYLMGALVASSSALPGARRHWFLGSLAVSGVSTAAMAMSGALVPFLILRWVGGVASAFVMVFAAALVLDRLAQAERPNLSAVHFAGVGNGIAVSAVLVAGLASLGQDWRDQWLWSGAVSLLALVAVFWLVPSDGEGGGTPPAATRSHDGLDRRFLALVVAYGLFGFGYVITATFISTMVRGSEQLAHIESVVWLAVGLAALPSVAFWTWLGRRAGNEISFALACGVEAIGVALSVLVAEGIVVLFAAALLGGTFMGITALGLIQARALTPGDARRSLGLMTASFGVGQIVGPTFAGLVADWGGGFRLPSLMASVALTVAAALVYRR